MSKSIKASAVDAVLDTIDDGADATEALIALVEKNNAWDWEGDETQPNARVAILESNGAYWAVGIQDRPHRRGWRVSKRCGSLGEAQGTVDAWCGA